jgi:phosphoglycolate phosphatase-like HAD superfamily hydrolase
LVTFAVLFDIDGTLVSSTVAEDDEKRRYSDAIRDVVGQTPNVAPGRFAGMVDPQICQILLTELGLPKDKVDYFVPRVLSRMSELYRKMDKAIALNTGVEELLPLLVDSPRHVVGVLTGNLEQIAREKLACAEIVSYFSEFYCADHYFDRTRLVADAVNSCVRKYQLPGSRNVMIVGDTPRDIAAANVSEATSIGIASSAFSVRQLSEAGAMQVHPNLKPTKQFLTGLGLDSRQNS